jgi:hypothetical protein
VATAVTSLTRQLRTMAPATERHLNAAIGIVEQPI